MKDSAPSQTPSRALTLSAAAVLLLSIPCFIFGLAFFDVKARIELQCQPGGPCTLTQKGWLSQEVVGTFPIDELQEAQVERGRTTRGDHDSIYRPVLVTSKGSFPLSYDWMTEESKATRVVKSINRFRTQLVPGFTIWHDDRPRASRAGLMSLIGGGLLLLLGGWFALRAARQRARERARSVPPTTAAP